MRILIRGAGDLATGIAYRLYKCGFEIIMTETKVPLTVRRTIAFSRAVYEGNAEVEHVTAKLTDGPEQIDDRIKKGYIPLLVDPGLKYLKEYKADVVVDAILAKKNLGTTIDAAEFVIGVGPGFTVGKDCHVVVETMRGHNLARIITKGAAMPNTGVPGIIGGFGKERVLHAPAAGEIHCISKIADIVEKDQVLAWIGDTPVRASLTGVLRGMIRDGFTVPKGMKIADIDPRKEQKKNCFTISDKARCIAGSVLEILLSEGVMPYEAPGRFSGTAAD